MCTLLLSCAAKLDLDEALQLAVRDGQHATCGARTYSWATVEPGDIGIVGDDRKSTPVAVAVIALYVNVE